MLFRFGVPCLFRFAASLTPGSGRRRYTVRPGGSLDRMEPEGVAEKLGAISWTGVGIFSRIFKSIRQTFAVTNVEWGGGKEAGGGFGFRCRKLSKAFGGLLRRNRLKAADGRESWRSDGLVKGESVLFPYEALPSAPNRMKNKTKRNGAFYYRERPDILW